MAMQLSANALPIRLTTNRNRIAVANFLIGYFARIKLGADGHFPSER
jgi:hypothetical protein